MRYREVKGHWPLMKPKTAQLSSAGSEPEDQSSEKGGRVEGERVGGKTGSRDEITQIGV
jgi:high-affinity iron transporter